MGASSCGVSATLVFVLVLCPSASARDVVWYISPNGSANITTCGRSPQDPCNNLTLILAQSNQFNNNSVTCYLSSGSTDGRDSTTIYFMGERNTVPPICLVNWTNVRITGLESNNTIISEYLGGNRGIFEFVSSTNISIENLNFATSTIGRATLHFRECNVIQITNCRFTITAIGSFGVQLLQCAGEIRLFDNEFYGNPFQDSDNLNLLALDVTHGCEFCNGEQSALIPFSLIVSRCIFRDIANNDAPEDSYKKASKSAVAMRLRFRGQSINNLVLVRDSNFTGILNSKANGVVVRYSGTSDNNSVLFQRCKFQKNRVRYGGGVSAYFYSAPANSILEFEDCDFLGNHANFEGGGIFVAFLSGREGNRIKISNSSFFNNSAEIGSGIFLLNDPSWLQQRGAFDPIALPLVDAELSGCVFQNNSAKISEGVVNAVRINLNISGISEFYGNVGSGVLLRASLLTMEGVVSFTGNRASAGGALNVMEGSRVEMSGVTSGSFKDNIAFQGGAISADSSSSSLLAVEYNHSRAEGNFGSCFIMFGNELRGIGESRSTRFIFSGNFALYNGHDIHSFSLQGCLTSNFVSAEVDSSLPLPSDGTILYNVSQDSDPLQGASTGPSFIFFYGASTRCFKMVNSVTYLLPNCSHALQESTFYRHPDMECGLREFNNELRGSVFNKPGTGLPPNISKLISPWAAIDSTWMQPPEVTRSQCPEPDPGNLVLSPAPGEQFDLTVQLADHLLNYVYYNLYLSVTYVPGTPSALIQYNGLQYGIEDRIYLTPNQPLSRLALVGAPGTEGHLRVVAASQIIGQDVELLIPFQLAQCPKGYFPPPTLLNVTKVQELIEGPYRITQRIPLDPNQPLYQPLACHCFSGPRSPVSFSNIVKSIPSVCIYGYTVQLGGSLWAGFIPRNGKEEEDVRNLSEFPPTISCLTSASMINPPSYVSENYTRLGVNEFDPVDVISYNNLIGPGGGAPVKCFTSNISDVVLYQSDVVFSIELCSQGYCNGDYSSNWVVANESFPCAKNRVGPLCGRCRKGYAVTLYSSTCRDCENKPEHYSFSLVLTLVLGLVMVVMVFFFNIGATPIIDSFLFFTQAVYLLLVGRNNYEVFNFLAFFHPNFTFNLCITADLDNFTKLVLQYVTPVYILLLMASTFFLSYFKRISRFLGKHSILQGIWLLFLISYLNIAMATFEMLYCRNVGPLGLNGVKFDRMNVLTHDPSVQCYRGLHLPFAIIAWVLLLTFIIPLPFYTIIATRIPKLKPLSDVYCSFYRDNRRWWIFLSLARRLLLVIVAVIIHETTSRHFGLLVCIAVILVVSVVTWPYKTKVENFFVLFTSWMLLLVAIITQPNSYFNSDPGQAISLTLVILTIFIGIFLIVCEIYLRWVKKKSIGEFYKESLRPKLSNSKFIRQLIFQMSQNDNHHEINITKQQTVDVTSYREPLLDSQFILVEQASTRKKKVTSSDIWGSESRTSASPTSTEIFIESSAVANSQSS